MTTIVYKDGVLACDGRESSDDTIVTDDANKIADLGGGFYLAGAGESDDRALRGLLSFKGLPTVEELRELKQEHSALYADTNAKKLYLICSDQRGENVGINELPIDRPHAVGAGGAYAQGAAMGGASAVDSVKIAKKIDVYSGGKVRSVVLW